MRHDRGKAYRDRHETNRAFRGMSRRSISVFSLVAAKVGLCQVAYPPMSRHTTHKFVNTHSPGYTSHVSRIEHILEIIKRLLPGSIQLNPNLHTPEYLLFPAFEVDSKLQYIPIVQRIRLTLHTRS